MKKTHIFTLILLFIYSHSFSQLEKKTWLIGGSGNYKSVKDINRKINTAIINGNIGYFLKDKFAVGLKPGFTHESTKDAFQKYIADFYQIGPFVRYYFLKKDSRLNLFSDIIYQFGFRTSNSGNNSRVNAFLTNAGCALFFNNNVALEFTIGYSTNTFSNSTSKLNFLLAGVGFQFHLTKLKNYE